MMAASLVGILATACLAVLYQLSLLASSPLLPAVEPESAAVVISGASTGIGKHATLSLAREGFHVFAGVRKLEDGDALLQSARKFQVDVDRIHPVLLDVTKRDQIHQAVDMVSEFVGDRGLHGLVNNAGIAIDSSTKSSSVEHQEMSIYRRTLDVNFFGLVELTQAFLPLLRQGRGRIVMNSSLLGIISFPFLSAYVSSKRAVEGFSDSLRRELLPLGVTVSVLEPHFITTPILSFQIPSESAKPYKEREILFWNNFWKETLGAPTPKVTSKAIVHAMRSRRPKIRYMVGKVTDILIVRFITVWLPDAWLDALLLGTRNEMLTRNDLQKLTRHREEFDL